MYITAILGQRKRMMLTPEYPLVKELIVAFANGQPTDSSREYTRRRMSVLAK